MDSFADGNQLPPLDDEITESEFWNGFKKWREATSTSPSGRHLGHYKVLLIPDGNDDLYDNDIINPSIIIKTVHFQLAMAAVRAGTTLDRWYNSSTLMLEKQPGISRIDKLRVIHRFYMKPITTYFLKFYGQESWYGIVIQTTNYTRLNQDLDLTTDVLMWC